MQTFSLHVQVENLHYNAHKKTQGYCVARPPLAERRSPWEPTALLDFEWRRATRSHHRDGCERMNNKGDAREKTAKFEILKIRSA